MKKYFLSLALMAITAFSVTTLRADDTNAPAAAADTNAVAAATNAVAATTNAPPPPPASMEQRLESLEAYISNGDPTAPLKDTNGNVVVTSPIMSNLANSTGSTYTYPGAGHNAWLLTSTALVLFMTLPGLALFYGGLVRKKNVLSVLAQCFLITGLVTIIYVICGYGMIFGGTGGASGALGMGYDWIWGVVGNPKACWLFANVTSAPNPG